MHVVVTRRVLGGGQEDQVAWLKRCDETVSMTLRGVDGHQHREASCAATCEAV